MKKHNIIFLFIFVFTLIVPSNLQAAEFDPSFIVSAKDLEHANSMNLAEIQRFLANRNSFLTHLVTSSYTGVVKSAAEIIYEASQTHQINPKWILVTLQKEQSLVDQKNPSPDRLDWAMGYAVCDSCSKSDPRIQKFRGFGNQVNFAAARIRYYIQYPHQFNFQAGKTYTIDNLDVTIKNQATAFLYNYTPHLHGNRNFWRLWTNWFSLIYPDGTLVQVEGEPGVWYIENGVRRPIHSKAVLLSRFNSKDVIKISKIDLESYQLGAPLKYANYSLVESIMGEKYMLVDDEKKKFESEEVFRRLGFNPEEIEIIQDNDLATYKEGRNITIASAYPLGQLIQDAKTGGVFFVRDGFKHPIVSKEILNANYPSHRIIKGDEATLNGFVTAEKVKFKDGKLVKSSDDPTVYVISNGNRRAIANEDTFKRLGYKTSDIITTSVSALALHPLGEPLDAGIASTSVIKTNNP